MVGSIEYLLKSDLRVLLGNVDDNHWRLDDPLLGVEKLDQTELLNVVQVIRAAFAINVQEVAADEQEQARHSMTGPLLLGIVIFLEIVQVQQLFLLLEEVRVRLFAEERERRPHGSIAIHPVYGNIVEFQKELLVSPVYLLNSLAEVLSFGLRANLRRTNVFISLHRLLELVLAQVISFETYFASVQRHEIYTIPVFNNSHRPIKRGLVFAEGACLGGVSHSSLDPHGLQPTVIEVDGILL